MPKKRMVVQAGPRARHDVPMSVSVGRYKTAQLIDEATEEVVPAQVHRGHLYWTLDHVPPNGEKSYLLETGSRTHYDGDQAVEVNRRTGAIDFSINGRPFTTYNHPQDAARPYFYPIIGPGQAQITRNYPMLEGIPNETTDHKHHRSLWVAHGDVNGTDNWSEERGHGWQKPIGVKECEEGPVFAFIRQDINWTSNRGKKLVAEERLIRIWNTPADHRIIDLVVHFKARHGEVAFGDTKEGGLCSVRVATSMDASRGGTIENSYGAIGEAEAWGRRAVWCDYSGIVNGKLVGIALFDTPGNLRYPTYWHVRDYGLMTANPFGISHFQPELEMSGDYVLEEKGDLRFAYRIYLHLGDATTAHIRDKYHDYINPPQVRLRRAR
jgi:hypothetical protein